MFHRAVSKFQDKWQWHEELNKFLENLVDGSRNVLKPRYGKERLCLIPVFLVVLCDVANCKGSFLMGKNKRSVTTVKVLLHLFMFRGLIGKVL